MWGESLVRWGVGMGRACAGCLVAVLEGAGVFASELCGVSAARFRRVPGLGVACAVFAGFWLLSGAGGGTSDAASLWDPRLE